MEVAWRGSELCGPVLDIKSKRAWGADAHKLMQLMMGQIPSEDTKPAAATESSVTLDLFCKADPSPRCAVQLGIACNTTSSPGFLELDPSEEPLPSGWEKCLDLKTGKLYYVNKSSGVSSLDNPRKRCTTDLSLAHEFLGSKKSETLQQENLIASSSSSSGNPRQCSRQKQQQHSQLSLFATGKQQWNLQPDDRRGPLNCRYSPEPAEEPEFHLELDLNLSTGGASSPSRRPEQQTVCTMEMIQNALKRTESKPSLIKREFLPTLQHKYSSFTSVVSAHSGSSGASPSTSSSSSTSPWLGHGAAPLDESRQSFKSSITGCEAECAKAENVAAGSCELVMAACTRCLTYVMLSRGDARCPRCEAEVPVKFGSAPVSKRQRVGPSYDPDRR
ncbi:uncharacterized protein [Physcomitrium patens]|uniref:WW domain-containing protein n=1 Tax=Physcomitrium patens TaxID=3218 RepID=A0A2K1J404_PHYPA|nr:uncharacterized protein LOC112294876 [Physcomitrium patens]XP_024401602.1 uncharacterized protein LOC112294876 [Physcomitrium patens]PNR36265.1 hypothetical protein PHYPA_022116 [Physcomitrium patens]|eukprot:XP_024401601.1 uncharacterized protein LOC112294876 [Physcomitrella patens]